MPAGKLHGDERHAGKEVPVAERMPRGRASARDYRVVLLAPIDGLYNHGSLIAGAIADVALFVLINGGFLGVVNKNGGD